MFSNDFKLHIECVETFNNLIGSQPDSIKEILDLIFKWSLIKMADSSNTKFAVAVFDFYANLLQALEEQEYMFLDFEAQILIPMLCEKTGLNNNIIKDKVKRLVRMLYPLYDRQKCYSLIVQYGLSSKNFKT
jgi:cytoskeleton-associated protein 5